MSLCCRAKVHSVIRSAEDIPKGKDPRCKRYHQKPFISKVLYLILCALALGNCVFSLFLKNFQYVLNRFIFVINQNNVPNPFNYINIFMALLVLRNLLFPLIFRYRLHNALFEMLHTTMQGVLTPLCHFDLQNKRLLKCLILLQN